MGELTFLQHFGLLKFSYRVVFGLALFMVACFLAIFKGQETVELKAFMHPASSYPYIFLAMGLFTTVMAGPALIPLLTVLAKSGICSQGQMGTLPEVRCGSVEHLLWVVFAGIAASLLMFLSVRLARVKFDLPSIEVTDCFCDMSKDSLAADGDKPQLHALSIFCSSNKLEGNCFI